MLRIWPIVTVLIDIPENGGARVMIIMSGNTKTIWRIIQDVMRITIPEETSGRAKWNCTVNMSGLR